MVTSMLTVVIQGCSTGSTTPDSIQLLQRNQPKPEPYRKRPHFTGALAGGESRPLGARGAWKSCVAARAPGPSDLFVADQCRAQGVD